MIGGSNKKKQIINTAQCILTSTQHNLWITFGTIEVWLDKKNIKGILIFCFFSDKFTGNMQIKISVESYLKNTVFIGSNEYLC